MSLSTRLTRLEMALLSNDRPALVVAFTDEGGRLVDAATGEEIALDALGPRTQLITITERSDGPQ